ncbi:KIN14F [Symbiodinium sp. CCMP2592]|nr:KIN14F [Symbiodinium sp. CCMP2592]
MASSNTDAPQEVITWSPLNLLTPPGRILKKPVLTDSPLPPGIHTWSPICEETTIPWGTSSLLRKPWNPAKESAEGSDATSATSTSEHAKTATDTMSCGQRSQLVTDVNANVLARPCAAGTQKLDANVIVKTPPRASRSVVPVVSGRVRKLGDQLVREVPALTNNQAAPSSPEATDISQPEPGGDATKEEAKVPVAPCATETCDGTEAEAGEDTKKDEVIETGPSAEEASSAGEAIKPEITWPRAAIPALPSSIRSPWEAFRDEALATLAAAKQIEEAQLAALSESDAFVYLYTALPPHIQYPFVVQAVNEAAAFVYYHAIQTEVKKPVAWEQLSAEQRQEMTPPFPHEYVRSGTAWHSLLPSSSLRLYLEGPPSEARALDLEALDEEAVNLLQALVQHAPTLFGMALPALQTALSTVKTESAEPGPVKQELCQALDVETCESIEQSLLEPYPHDPPKLGVQLHWGSVLHGLVRQARDLHGKVWPREIVILCASNADSLELLSLQQSASVLIVVLSTSSHWAVCFGRRGQKEILLCDGLQDSGIVHECQAFLLHLSSHWPGSFEIKKVPGVPQKDAWSCGHRVLVNTAAFLQRHTRDEWPPLIPLWTARDKALQELCEGSASSGGTSGSSSKGSNGLKRDHTGESDSSNAAAKASAKKPASALSSTPAPSPASLSKPVKNEVDGQEPVTPRAKKLKTGQGQAELEAEAANKPPAPKRRKLSEAQKREGWRQEGLSICRQHGVNYQHTFQKVHTELKAHLPANHWPEFLIDLGKNVGHMKCHACRALRRRMLTEGDAVCPAIQDKAEAAPAIQDKAEVQISTGRGRPPGGSVAASLMTWLDPERPGMYRQIKGTLFWCYVCKAEFNFQRLALSGKRFVLDHEATKRHRAGLSQQALAPSAKPSLCPGVRIGASVSSFDNVQRSCELWFQSGQLRCKVAEGSQQPFDVAVLSYENDQLLLKHKGCSGTHVKDQCCSQCHRLGESKELQQEVARWGMRLSLLNHARALALGVTEEREETQAALVTGDFMRFAPLKKEVNALLAVEQEEARLVLIKRKLDSINKSVRTERLDQWLRDCVVKLSFNKAGENERRAYSVLSNQFCEKIRSGEVSTKDLSLAARVASGELSSCKLVSCLVHSFFSMRDRMSRGCKDRLCSGKELDEETVTEIAVTLGLDGKCKTLLRSFGVSLGKKASVDYTSDTLPQFFIAHESMERLTRNAETAIQLLQAESSRSFFLAIDETCWKPSYSAVAGLRDPMQAVIIGGQFDSADNWSILESTENLPESKQAHLSLHFLLCRSDQIQKSYCISMLPMPHNSGTKAPLVLEYAGQALQATADANGVPAIGVAVDGGSSNSHLLKATLGLLSQDELSQATFFADCSVQPMPAKIKFWPFRSLLWKGKHQVLGSLDCIHGLKRYTTKHFSGTRTVHYGSSAMIPSTLLLGGIPYKCYVGYDAQSDKECFSRLNPTYIPAQPHTWGVWVYQLIGSLASFGWEGSHKMSAHDRFSDSCLGYYLLLIFFFLAKQRFPDTWSQHWLPIQTTRNLAFVCALGMVLAMPREDKETEVLGDCFAEKTVEHHFSAIKSHCRGRPSLRDGVTGTQKVHMAHAGKPLLLKKPEDTGPALTHQVATTLAASAWEHSLRFVTWVEPGLNSCELQESFQLWWASEGLGIFSMNKNHQFQDDESEEEDEEVLDGDSKEAAPDKDLETLQSIEDHIAAKAAMSAVVEAVPGDVVSDEADSAAQESAVGSRCFMYELKKCCDTEVFEGTDSSIDACLKRQQRLIPLIKAYVTQTRKREGFISVGGPKLDSPWHRMEHELALARAASLHDGTRMSRASQWRAVQSKVEHAVSTDSAEEGGPIRAITHYRPEQNDSRQTVVLRLEGCDKLQVGIVRAVFRGSVTKKSGETTRKMRTAKLSVHPLPASSCSRILVQHLVRYGEHSYYLTGVSQTFLVDPVQHVVGEVQISQCLEKETRIVCTLSKETVAAIAKLEAEPDLLQQMPLPNIPVPEPAVGEIKTEQKIYTFQDFSRTIAGTKAIEGWMRELPQMYETAGIELLKEGKIRVKMPGGQDKDFAWESIVLRTADAFDLMLDKLSGKKYGKTILQKFLDLLPDTSDKKKCVNQVRMFVAHVDKTAVDVCVSINRAKLGRAAKKFHRLETSGRRSGTAWGDVCILAYGATGSGKTHTVTNLAQRAAQELERQAVVLAQEGMKMEITVQLVEIYNDQLRDLLAVDSGGSAKRLRLSVCSSGSALLGARTCLVSTETGGGIAAMLGEVLRIGQAHRATCNTALNVRSSRSHLVMMLFLSCRDMNGYLREAGKLSLVDLAGSERLKRSEAVGERRREAQHINRSLSALADVISAKERRVSHVPYRNSKLTQLLQDALGGAEHCRTVVIVTLPPTKECLNDTLHSLQFSQRLTAVALPTPVVERTRRLSLRLEGQDSRAQLMQEVARWRAEFEKAQAQRDELKTALEIKDKELQEARRRNAALLAAADPPPVLVQTMRDLPTERARESRASPGHRVASSGPKRSPSPRTQGSPREVPRHIPPRPLQPLRTSRSADYSPQLPGRWNPFGAPDRNQRRGQSPSAQRPRRNATTSPPPREVRHGETGRQVATTGAVATGGGRVDGERPGPRPSWAAPLKELNEVAPCSPPTQLRQPRQSSPVRIVAPPADSQARPRSTSSHRRAKEYRVEVISDARVHELTGEKVSREKKSAKCPPSPALLLYPGFDEEEEADEDYEVEDALLTGLAGLNDGLNDVSESSDESEIRDRLKQRLQLTGKPKPSSPPHPKGRETARGSQAPHPGAHGHPPPHRRGRER